MKWIVGTSIIVPKVFSLVMSLQMEFLITFCSMERKKITIINNQRKKERRKYERESTMGNWELGILMEAKIKKK